jgi:hypothetical protein
VWEGGRRVGACAADGRLHNENPPCPLDHPAPCLPLPSPWQLPMTHRCMPHKPASRLPPGPRCQTDCHSCAEVAPPAGPPAAHLWRPVGNQDQGRRLAGYQASRQAPGTGCRLPKGNLPTCPAAAVGKRGRWHLRTWSEVRRRPPLGWSRPTSKYPQHGTTSGPPCGTACEGGRPAPSCDGIPTL